MTCELAELAEHVKLPPLAELLALIEGEYAGGQCGGGVLMKQDRAAKSKSGG